jgi:hypothetical protein
MKSALVIGAGIHGLTIATSLAKAGISVTIVEANSDILLGTSFGTHNRVNMGYHYPRSLPTAKECFSGYEYLKKYYNDFLVYPTACYYFIDAEYSKVNSQEYQYFCDQVGLKYCKELPPPGVISENKIQGSFKVFEPCYDVLLFKQYFKQKILDYGINAIFNFRIANAYIDGNNIRMSSVDGKNIAASYNAIINCTYAGTNNVQTAFRTNEQLKKYKFQKTEVAVIECPYEIPAVTVMDGPFCTVLPYASAKGKYLLYDVEYSINQSKVGTTINRDFYTEGISLYDQMYKKARIYYPFMKDVSYTKSLWATRPIPTTDKVDERITSLLKHDNHDCFYSVLEGKFVSAPSKGAEIAQQVLEEIC